MEVVADARDLGAVERADAADAIGPGDGNNRCDRPAGPGERRDSPSNPFIATENAAQQRSPGKQDADLVRETSQFGRR